MWKSSLIFLLVLSSGANVNGKIDEGTRANIHLDGLTDEPVIDYIMMVLTNLQNIFQNGIPEMGLEPLDPSDIGGVHYGELGRNYDVITDGSADFSALVRSGFSDVQVLDLSFDILQLSGALQMVTPYIYVTGSYSAAGTVAGAPVTATGDLEITSQDTTLNSTLKVGFNGTSIVVKDLVLELVFPNTVLSLTNLQGSPDLEAAVQQDLENFLKQLDSLANAKIESLRVTILNLLNDIFGLLIVGGELTPDLPKAMSSLFQRFGLSMGMAHLH